MKTEHSRTGNILEIAWPSPLLATISVYLLLAGGARHTHLPRLKTQGPGSRRGTRTNPTSQSGMTATPRHPTRQPLPGLEVVLEEPTSKHSFTAILPLKTMGSAAGVKVIDTVRSTTGRELKATKRPVRSEHRFCRTQHFQHARAH